MISIWIIAKIYVRKQVVLHCWHLILLNEKIADKPNLFKIFPLTPNLEGQVICFQEATFAFFLFIYLLAWLFCFSLDNSVHKHIEF